MSLLGLFFSACNSTNKEIVDKLNKKAYAYHYRDLDSSRIFADSALFLSDNYSAGKAEAYNNQAFVSIMQMNFAQAFQQLKEVRHTTNNQIELLIADIQLMRL